VSVTLAPTVLSRAGNRHRHPRVTLTALPTHRTDKAAGGKQSIKKISEPLVWIDLEMTGGVGGGVMGAADRVVCLFFSSGPAWCVTCTAL
jgi:hypothetical protein